MTIPKLIDVALFILVAVTLWSLDTVSGAGTNSLEIVRYGIIVGLCGIILLLAYLENWRRPISLTLSGSGVLLLAFLGYTALSVFWSAGGTQSVLKIILLSTVVITTLVAATVRPVEAIVRSIVIVCGAFVAIGAATALLVPSVGVESGWLLEGKWRGIAAQKNGYGALAAISLVYAIVQLAIPPETGRRRGLVLLTLAWAAFMAFCLIMAGSRGAQLTTLAGLAGLAASRASRSAQNIVLFAGLIIAIPLAAFAVLSFTADATELSVLGLTFDTSSRTQIWAYGFQELAGRELFGFGPSGFWTPERADIFKANNGWVLDNFHSGYITVLIEGGVVGAVLLVSALAGCFLAMRRLATGGDRYAAFAFAFLCMVLAQNFVENTFGRSTDFQFFCFLLLAFASSSVSRSRVLRHAPLPPSSRAEISYG